MANINRRARDVDGKISLGLNPEARSTGRSASSEFEHPDGSLSRWQPTTPSTAPS